MYKLFLKFIKSPKYYSHLIVKKTKTWIHNGLEPHVSASAGVSIEDFKIFLWQTINEKLS